MQKNKYMYIALNKCANTTFKLLFSKYKHILVPHNNMINKSKKTNLVLIKRSEEWNNYFKFTIVRHPISRFLSCINMIIRDKKIKQNNDTIDNIITIIINKKQGYKLGDTLKSYIKRHTLPLTHKHYCLLDDEGNLDIDYFEKLEDIKKNYNIFCKKVGINSKDKLPHTNKSTSYIKKSDLSKAQYKKLYNYYWKDFEIFGYK